MPRSLRCVVLQVADLSVAASPVHAGQVLVELDAAEARAALAEAS